MAPIVMTPIELVDTIANYLKEVVKEYDLETKKDGIIKAPEIHTGYLPDKKNSNEIDKLDFPYVIIRFLSEDDSNVDTVNIRLIIGTYSEDEVNGWRDPVNIATRIKIALRKKRVFGPFSLIDKIKIELFEEQPFPQWFTTMDLQFNIPQVQMDWSEHDIEI